MEHKLFIPGGILAVLGFFMSLGAVGGLETNAMSLDRGIYYAALGVFLLVFGLFMLLGAGNEHYETKE